MRDRWHYPRQLNGIGASLRLDTPRPENSALSGLKQFRTPGVSSPRDAANPVQCCLRAIPPIPHKCNWPFYIYTPFNEGGTHNYSSALSELTAHIIWTISCGAKRRCPRQQLQGVADSSWRSGGQRPVAFPFITGRTGASHRDISVLLQLPGQHQPTHPTELSSKNGNMRGRVIHCLAVPGVPSGGGSCLRFLRTWPARGAYRRIRPVFLPASAPYRPGCGRAF